MTTEGEPPQSALGQSTGPLAAICSQLVLSQRADSNRAIQTSTCSAMASASSTSMPRYRTVLSISCGQAKAGPHAGCRCDGRSASHLCGGASECRVQSDARNPLLDERHLLDHLV